MPRREQYLLSFHIVLVLALALLTSACRQPAVEPGRDEITVETEPFGPGEAELATLRESLLEHPSIAPRLEAGAGRLVYLAFEEAPADKSRDQRDPQPPTRFRARFAAYGKGESFEVTGALGKLDGLVTSRTAEEPLPNDEEFQEAAAVLVRELGIAEVLKRGSVELYAPMPPVYRNEEGERLVVVGVHSREDRIRAGLYGIEILRQRMVRLDHLLLLDHAQDPCEIPGDSSCDSTGSTGTVKVTIRQGRTTLWTFYAVRPAASSGHPNKGSGVELRHVRYRGKKLLYRAHVPILNVHYPQDLCGPYRDWQNEETCFKCSGSDVGSTGFRICDQPAKTFIDDQDDSGNFRGVGVHVSGTDVVLTSELAAGWYRYVSEWTFRANGTLQPRFKFGAVRNQCTCNIHFHHAYWRLDFDIDDFWDDSVREYAAPSGGLSLLQIYERESKSFRNQDKIWRVGDEGSEYYDIRPGQHDSDGSADSWAKGDVWVVRYHGNELEDGVGCVLCGGTSGTIQDQVFLTNEEVRKRDVVIWYRASFIHDAQGGSDGAEIVGPDLVPSPEWLK